MNLEFKRKLPTLQEIKAMYPIDDTLAEFKKETDRTLKNIFEGKDDRLLLVIGPCSADREDAVLDYIGRLRTVQEKVRDKIVIVPRIYTNKPRTTGDGYKGMLHQPDPHESENMLKGLIAIRKLHIKALQETGFSCADEMLYPEITSICPTCFPTSLSAQGRWKTNFIVLLQVVLTYRWV